MGLWELWLAGKIIVTMLLAGALLEGLYLLRKVSRKSQQLIYLLLILFEWRINGWIGFLTSLACGWCFFVCRKKQDARRQQ